jgi:predicted ATPase
MADLFGRRRASEHHLLVGRGNELDLIEQVLAGLERGPPAALELVGELGIGKSRLLSELATRAERRGHLVLAGSASELERELPFSVFVNALDEYVESLNFDLFSTLDVNVQAELAHVLPSLSGLGSGRTVALQHERYRSHRAVRALLERLAQERPLVVVLDDFHWADPASAELLDALLRRPPAAAVLTAVALRPRQAPERFTAALDRTARAGALTRIELGAFTLSEAQAFLAGRVDSADAVLLYQECGGNPFCLDQLARSAERTRGATSAGRFALSGLEVPAAVAASLSEELARLSDSGRLMLEGAAVAGDPFELELAAAAAAMPESTAMAAVDALLDLDLIRTTDAPRRFRFRHPLIRRAVYQATPSGWQLGAHERCGNALARRERRGTGSSQRTFGATRRPHRSRAASRGRRPSSTTRTRKRCALVRRRAAAAPGVVARSGSRRPAARRGEGVGCCRPFRR